MTEKKPPGVTGTEGAERIAAERARQISAEGYDQYHDDSHDDQELAWAAACYAAPEPIYRCSFDSYRDPWPWDEEDDKRVDKPKLAERIRQLEEAGAFIAAEIDRLLRTTW